MDKLDRLRRKAIRGAKNRKIYEHIIETAKEISEYIEWRKSTPLTREEKEVLRQTIEKFDKKFS